MKIWKTKLLALIIIGFLIGLSVQFLFPATVQATQTEYLPTSVEVLLACGDGFAEIPLEACDPGEPPITLPDLGTSTCADYNDIFGDPFVSGDLGCLNDCSNFSTSTCYTCGNGAWEELEQCDGSDFGGQSCETFGLISGSLNCNTSCLISLENCVVYDEESEGSPASGSSGGSAGGTSGYLPGSETEAITKVIISGKAYPNSEVHVLVDGKVIGIVMTDSKADFYFETTEVAAGVVSFGFWSEDKDGIRSTLLTLTIRVISRAVTTISGVYLSPSINVNKKAVERGEPITIYGQTVPETEVHIHVQSDNEIIELTNSEEDGDWTLPFDTSQVDEDYHIAKALFQIEVAGNIIKSGFSRSIGFYVGKEGEVEPCPGADLNRDGRVNLTDFSILLYWWGTDNRCADQDQDGTVDLIDFSIMMYHWTG